LTIIFHEYELLAKSGLFDPDYYLRANADVADLNVDPLMHYLEQGCREGRNPSAEFDAAHYLAQCLGSGERPTNPLLHYLTVGMGRGLAPLPTRKSAAVKSRRADKTARSSAAAKKSAARRRPTIVLGGIDTFGYLSAAGGWLCSGWLERRIHSEHVGSMEFTRHHEHSQNQGLATVAMYVAEKSAPDTTGFIAFTPGNRKVVGRLESICFDLDGIRYRAHAGDASVFLSDDALVNEVRPMFVNQSFIGCNRDLLMAAAFRPRFTGQDTLSALSQPVLLEIDEAIVCPPNGVLLMGWMIAARGAVRSLRVRSGEAAAEVVIAHSIIVPRPDVIAAVGYQFNLSDDRCGFICHVPEALSTGDLPYLEVELHTGEIGFKTFKLSTRSGIEAIRRILQDVQVRYADIDSAYDHVLGPAIASLNAARFRERTPPVEAKFGRPPEKPKCSLVIPLYGRVDFIEYQMALFSRHRGMDQFEIIYVLDDPTKRSELDYLSQSVFARFRLPFRLLCLGANMGFAPASNAGLDAAKGEFVCFLNSDIFPITDDWLERLIQRLREDPRIGIIGPRLLFEDGSIQHEGCVYASLPEFGNWNFVDHINKGHRPRAEDGLHHCEAITGACMVVKRSLARKLGGFDVGYIIGDFEDSDLCRKVQANGLACAVDNAVQLYHLERKSQSASQQNWRMNLTLYNAWVHQRRWFGQAADSGSIFTPA
jgi:GT2 family glycosyltransferase